MTTSSYARPFKQVRSEHSLESAEDYTELVAELIEESGEARIKLIAERMGISHVTALRTVRRLTEEGYFETAPHRPIQLTQKGRELAERAKHRHELLLRYLMALGVPEEVAECDVEGMEHHVSEQTLEAMARHLEKLT